MTADRCVLSGHRSRPLLLALRSSARLLLPVRRPFPQLPAMLSLARVQRGALVRAALVRAARTATASTASTHTATLTAARPFAPASMRPADGQLPIASAVRAASADRPIHRHHADNAFLFFLFHCCSAQFALCRPRPPPRRSRRPSASRPSSSSSGHCARAHSLPCQLRDRECTLSRVPRQCSLLVG